MRCYGFFFSNGSICTVTATNRLEAAFMVQQAYGADHFRTVLPRKFQVLKICSEGAYC